MKPHKHAEVIKAWADGAEIEYREHSSSRWVICRIDDLVNPIHYTRYEWRIKPEPKPDIVRYALVGAAYFGSDISFPEANSIFVFDGETGKLKSAEVLNA